MTQAVVDVSEAAGGRVRVTVAGELDLGNAADVQTALSSAVSNDTVDVELDLTDVTYLDSAGLRVLFAVTSRLQLSQTAFRVIAPPGSPARFAIEVSGLASICPVQPD